MTLARAERITGLEIREIPHEGIGTARTFAAYDGETEVAKATEAGEKRSLEVLVYRVYQLRSRQVKREQSYRCFCCFALGGPEGCNLEIDHVIPRGHAEHGRDDRRFNLRALLPHHHARRHDPWNPVEPEPHPKILELLAKHGLRWGGVDVGWIQEVQNGSNGQGVPVEPGGGSLPVRGGAVDPGSDD